MSDSKLNILVIFGSSRNDGNTMSVLNHVIGDYRDNAEIIMLDEQAIGHYDYQNRNIDDDFIPIATKMTECDAVVFASPVYWYAMSGRLKVFFDRFTDLITIRKDLGRGLKDKPCYVISCGEDNKIPKEFEKPFKATCQYLKMQYKGCFYYSMDNQQSPEDGQVNAAKEFGKKIFDHML